MTSTITPPPDSAPGSSKQLSIPTLTKAFTILVCLALLAVDARNIWRGYNANLKAAELSAQNITRSVAQHAGDTIKKADIVLFGLLGEIEQPQITPNNLSLLQPLLADRAAQLPEIQYFSIVDKDGRWILNSLGQAPAKLDFADREYFEFHKKNMTNAPHIGAPIHSRTTRDWILPVSRRINFEDGSFAGVVLAAIRLSYLNAYYGTFAIGTAGSITLLDRDGNVMMRRAPGGADIGRNVSAVPFFRDRIARDLDGVGTTSDYDGIERIVAFRQIDGFPLIAVVGLSTHEALTNWRDETIRHLIGIAVLLLLIGLLGHYLLKQIRIRARLWGQLVEAQKKLLALNSELERLALQDALTGLANRRQFDAALKIEFKRAVRKQNCLALLMIDVDNFKRYNDEFGHPAGDRCLQEISGVIHLQRPGDLSARYGGEEFAILLPDTTLAGAISVAQQIHQGTRNLKLPHPRNPGGIVTLSIGVACVSPNRSDTDPHMLLQAADMALYEAKANGRDRVVPDSCPATPAGATVQLTQ